MWRDDRTKQRRLLKDKRLLRATGSRKLWRAMIAQIYKGHSTQNQKYIDNRTWKKEVMSKQYFVQQKTGNYGDP